MFGSIRGKIIHRGEKHILVENNGIGYRISVLPELLLGIGNELETFLYLHTHVREDAFDLYGFKDLKELSLFELLLGVSGIGPKGAMGILSVSGVETLTRSIKTGDLAYLNKISGIGKKTAEKIILELRDKLGKETLADGYSNNLDVLEALKAIGYRENEVRDILKQLNPEADTNTKIKEALKFLGNK